MLRKQKWIHLTGCVTAVSYRTGFGCTSNMEILWNLFVLVNEISGKKKRGGVFYILLYVFFHLRTKFGGPFSALVTRIGNFVCLLAVITAMPMTLLSLPLFPSHWNTDEMPCMARWCCAVPLCGPRGDLWGSRFTAEVSSSHLELWERGWQEMILCGWRKDNAVLMSAVNWSLWLGVYCFSQDQQLINMVLEIRCVFVQFSVLS